ncbi:FAD-linked oxidase-like protein [Infundibulicybe gibba]|nr:FAD-linked oxidase-like protein [Infundibulicybe gibba]
MVNHILFQTAIRRSLLLNGLRSSGHTGRYPKIFRHPRTLPLSGFHASAYTKHPESANSPPTSTGTGNGISVSKFLIFLVTAIGSGVAGYGIATTSNVGSTTSGLKADSGFGNFGSPEDFQRAIKELKAEFSESEDTISTDPDVIYAHGFSSNDYHPGISHSVVVYPKSTQDVVRIVQIATKYRMPITPYSGATSLEGHFRGHNTGGICVDMRDMDQILEIHEADSDMVCQAGASWTDINSTLRDKGIPLFFPVAPEVSSVVPPLHIIDDSVANAVRYGTAKGEWFLNATVVLPSGEVIKTRRRSRKSSAGFDTTKLFIGAEGTLGIVTEVTIRLAPVLPTTVAAVHFPDVRRATEAVLEIMNQGVGIQCVELLDATFMHATNKFGISTHKWPEQDSLFFKFQGPTPASLAETARIVEQISGKHGGFGFRLASSEQEADDIWADRKNAHYSGLALLEGGRGWSTDVCVPVSKLPELVYETKKDLSTLGIISTIVGHVGDGNFHSLLLFKTDEELEIAREAVHRMVKRAIALDGTCTGEHGVGIGKRGYLVEELGAGTVGLMKTVKRAIDPLGLFNPGKLYPDDDVPDVDPKEGRTS